MSQCRNNLLSTKEPLQNHKTNEIRAEVEKELNIFFLNLIFSNLTYILSHNTENQEIISECLFQIKCTR